MPRQPAFSGPGDALKKKVTQRKRYLAEANADVHWNRRLALIEPHYPRSGSKGERPATAAVSRTVPDSSPCSYSDLLRGLGVRSFQATEMEALEQEN